MVSKHADAAPLEGTDNFRLIKGIGPAIERRLHRADIRTYAQLADLSPEEIARAVSGLAGLSAGKIANQDWIGQARELASKSATSDPNNGPMTAIRQHYATFQVQLLLNENNDVRSTRVVYVPPSGDEKTGAKKTWAGWQDRSLIAFFVQHAALRSQSTEPVPTVQAGADFREASLGLAKRPTDTHTEELSAGLQLDVGEISLVEVPAEHEADPQEFPKRLRAQINFQLTGQATSLINAQQSSYLVQFLACNLETGRTTVLASARQQLQSNAAVTADPQQPQSYVLSHSTSVEFVLPDVGRYQLLGTIVLPDSNTVRTGLGPIFRVVP